MCGSHLAVKHGASGFIGGEDRADVGCRDVGRAHGRGEDSVVEQAATGTEHERERDQAETVDESVRQQGLQRPTFRVLVVQVRLAPWIRETSLAFVQRFV